MKKIILALILLLILPLVIAEEQIISGDVQTTTQNGSATITITVEGTSSQQQISCMEDQTNSYPIQIKKDLTCVQGTVEKCDEKFSNLTSFMNVFSSAYNHTLSNDYSYCIDARLSNKEISTKLADLNSTFTECETTRKELSEDLADIREQKDSFQNQLSECKSKPTDCSEENQTIKDENKNTSFWVGGFCLLIGFLACYFYYFKKETAKTQGNDLPRR